MKSQKNSLKSTAASAMVLASMMVVQPSAFAQSISGGTVMPVSHPNPTAPAAPTLPSAYAPPSAVGAAPVAARPAAAPAAPAAAAPVVSNNGPIDASKCLDMTAAQAQLKNQIVKTIRDAQSQGLKPAIAYEGTSADARSVTPRVDARANKEADATVRALFAAVSNPQTPASAASKSMMGDSSRRASFQMYARCEGEDVSPRQIVNNSRVLVGDVGTCASGGKPVDMSMNAAQIFETSRPVDDVMVRFARSKVASTESDTVAYCNPVAEDRNCKDGEDYGPVGGTMASRFVPKVNSATPYYLEDTTVFSKTILGMKISAPTPMVNRTAVRVNQIDVCGSKAYLVTSFGNGADSGFDRSTLVGVIASIGNKTVVIGDASAQAWQPDSWPLDFAQTHYKETMLSIFGEVDPNTRQVQGGYNKIARLIGSTESPVLGELSGGADDEDGYGGGSRGSRQGGTYAR